MIKSVMAVFLFILSTSTVQALEFGDLCDPAVDRPIQGAACKPLFNNGEPVWNHYSAQVNAERGDILLSKGCGMIGSILKSVQPSQSYSHTGIMIKNRYNIRHSTMAVGRLNNYFPEGETDPRDGFRGEVISYGWPGTINQSIEGAFIGETFKDPGSPKHYLIENSFYPHLSEEEVVDILDTQGLSGKLSCLLEGDKVVPPLVVRSPLPKTVVDNSIPADAIAARQSLNHIANQAEQIDGYYSLHQYSDATIENTAPEVAIWPDTTDKNGNLVKGAEGRVPTVCSSFIYKAAKAEGITLEGKVLEPFDIGKVEISNKKNSDGLYYYSPAERLAAAKALRTDTENRAYRTLKATSATPEVDDVWTDATDNVATQITNCFIHGYCSGINEAHPVCGGDDVKPAIDNHCWLEPGIGIAVSPQDILSWDYPYGHFETLQFFPGEYVQQYSWQLSEGVGSITGSVREFNGLPAPGATVTVGGRVKEVTGDKGKYSFANVPAGSWSIQAIGRGGVICGKIDENVILNDGDEKTGMDVFLDEEQCKLITPYDREVRIKYKAAVIDYEPSWVNEVEVFEGHEVFDMGPVKSVKEMFGKEILNISELLTRQNNCVGEEVVPIVTATTIYTPNNNEGFPIRTIDTTVAGQLFEGVSCSTHDLDGTGQVSVTVKPGESITTSLQILTDEFASGYDRIGMDITVSNCRRGDSDAECND